jgi:hypothetical protein
MSNVSNTGKKIGRPAVNATPLTVRVPPDLLADLDRFIAEEPDPKPSRPDAIRRLLSDALVAMGLRKPS